MADAINNFSIMKQDTKEKPLALLSWKAPEFRKYEKTILWDAVIFGVTLLLTLWGIWSSDIVFTALVVLAGILLWHYGTQEPKEVSFAVRSDGIQAGSLLYNYKILESFWVFYEPGQVNELMVRTKKTLFPLVHINLDREDPEEIRKVLKSFLEEKEEHYPISHALAHIIGY